MGIVQHNSARAEHHVVAVERAATIEQLVIGAHDDGFRGGTCDVSRAYLASRPVPSLRFRLPTVYYPVSTHNPALRDETLRSPKTRRGPFPSAARLWTITVAFIRRPVLSLAAIPGNWWHVVSRIDFTSLPQVVPHFRVSFGTFIGMADILWDFRKLFVFPVWMFKDIAKRATRQHFGTTWNMILLILIQPLISLYGIVFKERERPPVSLKLDRQFPRAQIARELNEEKETATKKVRRNGSRT